MSEPIDISTAHDLRKWHTPPQVARRYGIKADRVIAMIRAGEFRAIDVSSPGSRRPRFRIHDADLVAFENRREVRPSSQPKRRRRKQTDVIEYF